jgi:hypothetical protein
MGTLANTTKQIFLWRSAAVCLFRCIETVPKNDWLFENDPGLVPIVNRRHFSDLVWDLRIYVSPCVIVGRRESLLAIERLPQHACDGSLHVRLNVASSLAMALPSRLG